MIRNTLPLALMALTLLAWQPAHAIPIPGLGKLRTSGSIRCGQRQKLVLQNYLIDTQGTGLLIEGRCKVSLINSVIRAGEHGILLRDRGKLSMINSTIRADQFGVKAIARGKAAISTSVIKSKRWALHATQRAKIVSNGGNVLTGGISVSQRAKIVGFSAKGQVPPPTSNTREPAPPQAGSAAPSQAGSAPPVARWSHQAPPKHLRIAKPIRCIGNKNIILQGRIIRTDGIAISMVGNCMVKIVDSWIKGSTAIKIVGNGNVKIIRSYIAGGPAIDLMGNGNVSANHSTIKGAINKIGHGHFHNQGHNTLQP